MSVDGEKKEENDKLFIVVGVDRKVFLERKKVFPLMSKWSKSNLDFLLDSLRKIRSTRFGFELFFCFSISRLLSYSELIQVFLFLLSLWADAITSSVSRLILEFYLFVWSSVVGFVSSVCRFASRTAPTLSRRSNIRFKLALCIGDAWSEGTRERSH